MPSDRFEIVENLDRILACLKTCEEIGMQVMAERYEESHADTYKNLTDTIHFVKDMKILIPHILYLGRLSPEQREKELKDKKGYLPKVKVFYDTLEVYKEDIKIN